MRRHIHVILATGAAMLLAAGLNTALARGPGGGAGMGPQGPQGAQPATPATPAQPATPAKPATPAQPPMVDVQMDRDRDRDRDMIKDKTKDQDKLKDQDTTMDRDRVRDRDQMQDTMGQQRAEVMYSKEQQEYNRQASPADKRIYGWQIMTPAERSAYHVKMRSLRTMQARDRFQLEHQDQMQQRAAQMGIDLENPPPTGNGMGGDNMRGDQAGGQRAEMMYSKERQEEYNRQASPADKRIYGWQIMSPAERSAYRAKVHSLRTIQERDTFRIQHHAQMQERAQEMGVALPDMPQQQSRTGGGDGG